MSQISSAESKTPRLHVMLHRKSPGFLPLFQRSAGIGWNSCNITIFARSKRLARSPEKLGKTGVNVEVKKILGIDATAFFYAHDASTIPRHRKRLALTVEYI
jgi:hypothetical protein